MKWFKSDYDPDLSTFHETFSFFGSPQIHTQTSPVHQFFNDVGNVLVNARLTLHILAVFRTERSIDELYLWSTTVFSLVWFTLGSIVQFPFVTSVLVGFLFTAAVLWCFVYLHDFFVWRVIQGPQIQVWPPTLPEGYQRRHRWIYINGVATGKTITRQNLQGLSQTFHNPVLAVNNRTYGLMGDLVECVLQRSFGFRTTEVGITYDIIRKWLEDHENIDRVIFVAHSQGGIIASQVLDQLYCSMSPDELCKLEVYTFGSAALQCNNPYRDKSKKTRMVPVMEHYCNEKDMVTSWGALSSVNRNDIPFEGKVFVFHGQTGHMLNQHYLKHMFTGKRHTWKEEDFQRRAVTLDATNKSLWHVGSSSANKKIGDVAVQDVSTLWKYL